MAIQASRLTSSQQSASVSAPRAPNRSLASVPELTVVVPTRDERDNISPLLERLEKASRARRLEVIFVDDSTDDTAHVIGELAERLRTPVKLIHRPPDQRDGGLGGAVLAGLKEARAEFVCVMDADLQHPPELLGALLDEARSSQADLVLASRYCPGGNMGEFSTLRKALSRSSALVARAMFPVRLRGVSDPMSGFFLVRRTAIEARPLRPRGFKILLEILLCGGRLHTSEVAFRFGERHAGESKASVREGARYLRRLIELRARRIGPEPLNAGPLIGDAITAAWPPR